MKIFKRLISIIKPVLITSNLIVFITFVVTGFVMYRLGNRIMASIIFFAAFLYIVFNKIESMDRRIKLLEDEKGKQEGDFCFLENRISKLEEK